MVRTRVRIRTIGSGPGLVLDGNFYNGISCDFHIGLNMPQPANARRKSYLDEKPDEKSGGFSGTRPEKTNIVPGIARERPTRIGP